MIKARNNTICVSTFQDESGERKRKSRNSKGCKTTRWSVRLKPDLE